jgi:hypothetical protein
MHKPPAVVSLALLPLACLLLYASDARAQIYESIGTRAQGMAGAFVAVADDATATWWNPAGLATGAYFSAIYERGQLDDPGDAPGAGPARRDLSSGFALTVPSLGLSYYRLRAGEVRPSGAIAGGGADRQEEQGGSVDLRAISLRRFGVTIGQSIGSHLVVASTVGVLRGGEGAATEAVSSDAIGHATDLDVGSETHGDVDLGAMLMFGRRARLGLNVKHVNTPTFGSGDAAIELRRQVRAGGALFAQGRTTALTLAADVDLTKTPTVTGDVQHVAAGAEILTANRRIGIRGGISGNLVGAARTAASAGLSLGVTKTLYVDGAKTFGDDTTRSGWGLTLRATF